MQPPRTSRRFVSGAVVVAALCASLATACGGDSAPAGQAVVSESATTETASAAPATDTAATTTDSKAARPGGTYRVGVESSFGFTAGLDPTAEYWAFGWGILGNLLTRTLLGFKHTAGPEGNELIPDLAVGMPEISSDGLTYTLRLKDGIRFGPPVSREITSDDVRYAFERIGTPAVVAQYGYHYDVIEGMLEFKEGTAETISGIETPDEKTVVFRLTRPTGDFAYRLALPASGPIPEEVAECFPEPTTYGRHLVSSGPYMYEGSESLDLSSCDSMKPIAGFKPNSQLVLVRNPEYDPATDSPEARENFPDRFEFVINSNNSDIFNRVRAGDYEGEFASVTPELLREYSENEELAGRLAVNSGDSLIFVTLNLTQPPFDDIHVRKAVNLALDKEGVRRALGGERRGEIATHIVPDTILNDVLAGYDPYPSDGFEGDVAAAMEEMKLSRYDTDKDGICDAEACQGIVNVSDVVEAARALVPPVEESLARIGVELDTKFKADAIVELQSVATNIPMSTTLGWSKDYADASVFMVLFDSRSINPTGNVNFPLVGLTPELASSLDGLQGNVDDVPSVDAAIDACAPLVGEERVRCWAELDRTLMEEVAPIVPLIDYNEARIIGPTVTKWDFDQSSANTAWAHVAVDPSAQ
jgi:peptide/nickel transport system substrate-binding protein